jgi:subtilisin family serine protease
MRRRLVALFAAALLATGVIGAPAAAAAGETQTYIVLYRNASAEDAAARVARAGGTLVVNHAAIGVVVARSSQLDFAARMRADNRVEGVAVSKQVGAMGPLAAEVEADHDEQPPELPNAPAGQDALAPLQWDMRQIHAFEAHAITGGSPAVIVGDIDTGVDKDHPDLIPNLDFSRSVSCESGFPDPDPAAWDDRNGHGTHTTGTMAAAANGFGITGVAPHVKIAAIKSSLDSGYFFVEMVVCSFMWAAGAPFDNPTTPGVDLPATVGPRVDVTNNSYYMDPFLYNCRNDPEQRLLWKAAQRAILYADQQGVTNVAAQGNDSDDRAHPTYDASSPDYPPGNEVERDITNACVVVPLEVPGVIGVTSVGNRQQVDDNDDPTDYQKAYYSAYGVGVAEVTAPGGDSTQITPEAFNGRILSTWPAEVPCARPAKDPDALPAAAYCYIQGTSMASPHAAGVAALIVSRFGDLDNPQNGKMRPGSVAAYLQQTADAQPCPTEVGFPYNIITRPDGSPQECQGGEAYNSWYGTGQVNALRAVTHDAGGQ